MHFCDKCKLEVLDEVNHCPLCGRCISENDIKSQKLNYYPCDEIVEKKRNRGINIILWLTLIGISISCVVDLLIHKQFIYSWYVITGGLIFIFDFIFPIKKKWSFSFVCIIVGVSISLYILFLELYTHSFGWGIEYAIPFFNMFLALYSTIIILLRNYYLHLEFSVPLIIFSIICTTLFMVTYFMKFIFWPSMVAFLTSIVCLLFVLIFRFRKVKQEVEKNFFI